MIDRFRGKLTEKKFKREDLATLWGVNIMTVTNKMTGKTPLRVEEFTAACKFFNLSDAEVLYILYGESRLRDPLNDL